MLEKVYQAADGIEVHLSLDRWVYHIQDGHPGVVIEDLEDALLRPARIYQHFQFTSQRVYEGNTRTTGFIHGQSHPRAVIEIYRAQVGRVLTLHLAPSPYRGIQLWP